MIPVPAGFDHTSSGFGRIQNSGSGRSLSPLLLVELGLSMGKGQGNC